MATVIQPPTTSVSHFPSKLPLRSFSLFKTKPHICYVHCPPVASSIFRPLISSHLSLSEHEIHKPAFTLDSFHDCQDTIDADDLLHWLRLSIKYADVELIRAVHALFHKLQHSTRVGNCLISAYLKMGFLVDAYGVFTGLHRPDVVSYTALISSLAKENRESEAVELFFRMRRACIEPNDYSFVGIVTACIRVLDFELGLQVHALALKMGFLDSVFVANTLMALYSNCGSLDYVVQLFDEMGHRDIASWNTLLSSFVKESLYDKALQLFRNLPQDDKFKIDHFTLSTLLTACTESPAVMDGRGIHGYSIRIGLEGNLSLSNAIIRFYTRCGSLKDVVAVFERMAMRDVVTWTEMMTAYLEFGCVDLAVEIFEKMPEINHVSYNALLDGFCRNGEGLKALNLFIEMAQEGIELSDSAFTSVLNACGLLARLDISRQIHGFVVKFGFMLNAIIEAALIDAYMRCGRMKDADKMFSSWPTDRDSSIIQTSMLCGYARNGMPDEAISLFHRSQHEGNMVLDEVALSSILGVCGTLGFLEMGKQLHCRAIKTELVADLGVGNSIVSMYSKCYNIIDAIRFFNRMPTHDIISWNALIAGHLLHRQGDEALAVWSRLKKADLQPDAVTFMLILSSYKHTSSNLVNECQVLFHSMKKVHNTEPSSEHFAALVSVLGSWGLLEEAEQLILNMPFEPEASVWRALLDSCRLHLNTNVGKRTAKRILAMEPQDPSTYVLVSNLYSASGRWHCSDIVRDNMREKGIKKHPCRSWAIHQNRVHSFFVRDKSHPQTKDIYSGLEILILECLKAGYEPDTSFVLHEVEEHQKKDFLFCHSAKLAATYALLMTRPGEPVQIFKNILLCGDCHTFLKYVTVVTGRDISVRDASGFHFFANGHCSCKDYW
ncbi:hypothetical protein K2173_001917 [Erythroxylum novogranatense]|uniref:DYW domain-containing protein n=1 Tax=Erythroxylum novogranatense TaxID=1862640 RepID=A0AAV8SQ33_9ROSI|nr:hypothetical protein K2173_001917 [Erythroxylum novogranatense]